MYVSTPTRRPESRFLRIALSLFLLVTCVRVWIGPEPMIARAQAQIPDAGLQRKLVLDEARRSNQLLSDIKRILESQTLNVRMEGADNQAGNAPGPRRSGP